VGRPSRFISSRMRPATVMPPTVLPAPPPTTDGAKRGPVGSPAGAAHRRRSSIPCPVRSSEARFRQLPASRRPGAKAAHILPPRQCSLLKEPDALLPPLAFTVRSRQGPPPEAMCLMGRYGSLHPPLYTRSERRRATRNRAVFANWTPQRQAAVFPIPVGTDRMTMLIPLRPVLPRPRPPDRRLGGVLRKG